MAEDASSPSLLDQARERALARKPQCTVASLIKAHPDKAEQIQDLLDNTGEGRGDALHFSVAADVLSSAIGTKIDGQTIGRHVRGRCACQ